MGNSGTKITAPVSMTDIATVIGESTDVARSGNIKSWAKYKPFESHDNPYIVQDEAARKKGAYGFYWWNVNQEEEAPFELSAYHLYEKIMGMTDDSWQLKPVSRSRMGDFVGYDHNAHMPYAYGCDSSTHDHNKEVYLTMESGLSEGNLIIEDMPAVFGTEIADYSVRCIYRKSGESDIHIADSGYYVGDLSASNYASVAFRVPPTVKGNTDVYYYIWAATNADDSGAERIAWLAFPNSTGVFTYDGYYDVKYAYDTDYLSSPFEAINVNGYEVTSAAHEVKSLMLVLEAFHNFNYEAEGKLILHVWGREQGWDSGIDYEIDAMNDGATIFDINIEDATQGYVRADDTLMALSVYVRDVREPIVTAPNYTSYHFDFENNGLQLNPATSSDGISVWRMMEIKDNFRQ